MGKRKRQAKWMLLFREEGREKVYLYEPLKKYELKSRLKLRHKERGFVN